MSKTLMLAAVLLLSAAWLQAQQTPDNNTSGSSQTSSGQMGSDQSSAGSQTVEGCLSGSSGSYTLTSDSGTTYQLSGDTSKLSEHVGHEIQVKGKTAGGNGASTSSASSGGSMSGSQNTLTVDHVKMISKTCKTAGASK